MKCALLIAMLCVPLFGIGQNKRISKIPGTAKATGTTSIETKKVNSWDNFTSDELKVGDQVPEVIATDVLNYRSPTLKLADFKGKYVILDFWATTCASCLHHIPAADSITREFKDDLQVILVDSYSKFETLPRITKTLSRLNTPNSPKMELPVIINDTRLSKLFPHYSVPHYAWIDRKGFVIAITSSEQLTRSNVRKLISDGVAPKYQKKDFTAERPLYSSTELPIDHLEHFSILLRGKIDGIGGSGGFRMINNTARGVILHNKTLMEMYTAVVSDKMPGLSDNRLIMDVKDPADLLYKSGAVSRADWKRSHVYSYELIVPAEEMHNVYDYVLDDLNRYTPFEAAFEKRRTLRWQVEKQGQSDLIHTKGGKWSEDSGANFLTLSNTSILSLIIYVNKLTHNAVVLDKTGYTGNVDLNLTSVTDMASLIEKLKSYGLILSSGYEDLEMLVIKDKSTPNSTINQLP